MRDVLRTKGYGAIWATIMAAMVVCLVASACGGDQPTPNAVTTPSAVTFPSAATSASAVTFGSITISAESEPIFTGDQLDLKLIATDQDGNFIEPESIIWSATLGTVEGDSTEAKFSAGRNPGVAQIRVEASRGGTNRAAFFDIEIQQGYCNTRTTKAQWLVTAWERTNSGGKGPSVGGEVWPGNFAHDWGAGAIIGGRKDQVVLEAKMDILLQRQGLVGFTVGGDDGYRLFLDGELITPESAWSSHSYRKTTLLKALDAGIHRLRLEYFEAGSLARLEFNVDGDVLQWSRVKECFGGYSRSPRGRYLYYALTNDRASVADQFGIPTDWVLPVQGRSPPAFVIPGEASPPRTVIVLQGIDTASACSDFSKGLSENTFATRVALMTRAIQLRDWEQTRRPSDWDDKDFVTFSYSNTYRDCRTGSTYRAGQLPIGFGATQNSFSSGANGIFAEYRQDDTCGGVSAAANDLKALMNRISDLEPGTKFVLVGHSLGGMVAAYALATMPVAEVRERIHSVVTLDAPLRGYGISKPGSACFNSSPSWHDIMGFSDGSSSAAVRTIGSLRDSQVRSKVHSFVSSPIGTALPGAQPTNVDCAAGVKTGLLGAILGAIVCPVCALAGGAAGFGIGQWGTGHTCIWLNQQALSTTSDVIRD